MALLSAKINFCLRPFFHWRQLSALFAALILIPATAWIFSSGTAEGNSGSFDRISALPLVIIDPGHGGEKLGTVSDKGVPEKELTLSIALKLDRLLSGTDVRTHLTRSDDSDIGLKDRIKLANDEKAALFISIHLNAMPSKWARKRTRGIETYFLARRATGEHADSVAAAENAEGAVDAAPQDDLSIILADLAESEAHQDASDFAYVVHEKMTERLPTRDRGVHQAPFMVLKGALMPAILVEIGYLSHPEESENLVSDAYQEKAAQALAYGILGYLIKKGLISEQQTLSLPTSAEHSTPRAENSAGQDEILSANPGDSDGGALLKPSAP